MAQPAAGSFKHATPLEFAALRRQSARVMPAERDVHQRGSWWALPAAVLCAGMSPACAVLSSESVRGMARHACRCRHSCFDKSQAGQRGVACVVERASGAHAPLLHGALPIEGHAQRILEHA